MDVRRGFVVLVGLVAATTAIYAVYPNGEFSPGGRLPGWIIAAAIVTTVGVAGAVLWWLARVVGWSTRPVERGTADTYLTLVVIAGLCHGLGTVAETVLDAPTVWLVMPIATMGYGGFIVWFQKRHGSTH